MKRVIELLAIMVAAFGCMIVDTYTFAPLVGIAIASVLWRIKVAIWGKDVPEPINEDELM